jgi:hypothetical protein
MSTAPKLRAISGVPVDRRAQYARHFVGQRVTVTYRTGRSSGPQTVSGKLADLTYDPVRQWVMLLLNADRVAYPLTIYVGHLTRLVEAA